MEFLIFMLAENENVHPDKGWKEAPESNKWFHTCGEAKEFALKQLNYYMGLYNLGKKYNKMELDEDSLSVSVKGNVWKQYFIIPVRLA